MAVEQSRKGKNLSRIRELITKLVRGFAINFLETTLGAWDVANSSCSYVSINLS